MKWKPMNLITGLILSLSTAGSHAQISAPAELVPIPGYTLTVSSSKTTTVLFPQAILTVDRGSKDVLAQKAQGVENVLLVKAARPYIKETNLTVVTADGKVNSFLINYAENPAMLSLSVAAHNLVSTSAHILPKNLNISQIQSYAEQARGYGKKLSLAKDESAGMFFRLDGVFIREDILYFRLYLGNAGNVGYDIDQLRFFIRDQQRAKRTANQEMEVLPIDKYGYTDEINSGIGYYFVYAVPKFIIPEHKYLIIELMEKNGGRNLELSVKNKAILNSRVLSPAK